VPSGYSRLPAHFAELFGQFAGCCVRILKYLSESVIGGILMRRLLVLAALIFALWAIDSYAFNGRYRAAFLEEVNYYARTFIDGVQRFVNRIRL
jgi:hypothetical protein